jgi:hypothetical protein
MRGRYELPPREGVRYVAAVDPSGGGADTFTLAIVHAEGQGADRRVVQDVMRGWGRRGSDSVDLASVVHAGARLRALDRTKDRLRSASSASVLGSKYDRRPRIDGDRAERYFGRTPRQRTPEEQSILDFVAKSHGQEWVNRHAALILQQAWAIGEL